MKRILIAFCMATVFALVAQAQSRSQDDGNYIVTFRGGTSQSDRAAAVQRAGGSVRTHFSIIDAAAITAGNPNVLAALQRNPNVARITRDHVVHAIPAGRDIEVNGKPGGGGGGGSIEVIQPGVLRVGRPRAGSDGSGIRVAIVDTGIDLTNPEFAGAIVGEFSAFGGSCQDDEGHGTHVAGIVGARENNGIGTVGVAPNAFLYCVKVLDRTGSGSDSAVIAGLNHIFNNDAANIKVVNMSLGRDAVSEGEDAPMRDAIQALVNKGITVVVAAGNDPAKDVSSQVPAGFSSVVSVASTTAAAGTNNGCRFNSTVIQADTASFFTTDGAGVTVSAPGDESESISRQCFLSSAGILSTRLGGGTTRMSGTSMAAPHVTGIVARLLQNGVLPADVKTRVQNDAAATGTAPLNSPSSSYTNDGVKEGIAQAP